MHAIGDVLALLTEQHRHIEELIARVRAGEDHAVLVDYVAAHLAVERELFYPRIARQLSEPVRAELAAEHAEIRRILGDLIWCGRDHARFGATLDQLGELLAGHCGWQDEVLCERLAAVMPPAARADLAVSVGAGFAQRIHQV